MAEEYLGLRAAQVEVEHDSLDEARNRVAELDRAIQNVLVVTSARDGLTSKDIGAAVAELTGQREAARRHVTMIEAWQADSAQESERMRRLWELAEHAHKRLPFMAPDEQRQVLEILDVRVTILEPGSRKVPARIRLEGTVLANGLLAGITGDVDDRWFTSSRFRGKGHLPAHGSHC
jgi:hypothetical protein